jgi:hypothetical protein
MNPLQQFKDDPKIGIQCDTEEEFLRINKYIVELGGQSLAYASTRYTKIVLYMEDISRGKNKYSNDHHAISFASKYTIIHSSQIKDPNDGPEYQIF